MIRQEILEQVLNRVITRASSPISRFLGIEFGKGGSACQEYVHLNVRMLSVLGKKLIHNIKSNFIKDTL